MAVSFVCGNSSALSSLDEAFHNKHEAGREIGSKHGTASHKPAQNRELSSNTRAERFYELQDENIKMKTH